MRSDVDRLSLSAGMAVTALGTLLILDQTGVLELTAGWLGAAVAATLGAILLLSGVFDRGE